jgi:hypothetical protein
MKLKHLSFLVLSAGVLLGSTGCHLFGKSKKPKANAAIAASVDADFRQRWVERRVIELTGQGKDAVTARSTAEAEFREKYAYLKEEKK